MEKITANEIKQALPQRRKNVSKSDFGHVLIIGGEYGMAGAVQMAGMSAARVGAGLTTVATRPEHAATIAASQPELMCKGIQHADDLYPLIKKATVIVIGPGLGQSEWSKMLFEKTITLEQAKVVDADGLNLLAKKPTKNENWILTPHPGEAARLLDTTTEIIQKDRQAAINNLQNKYGGVIVLKGAGTLVKSYENAAAICEAGNPGMATGGMGDVLSGVLGGLLAQKLTLEQAARVGVLIHSLAADEAAEKNGERGILATDLLPYLHHLVNP